MLTGTGGALSGISAAKISPLPPKLNAAAARTEVSNLRIRHAVTISDYLNSFLQTLFAAPALFAVINSCSQPNPGQCCPVATQLVKKGKADRNRVVTVRVRKGRHHPRATRGPPPL